MRIRLEPIMHVIIKAARKLASNSYHTAAKVQLALPLSSLYTAERIVMQRLSDCRGPQREAMFVQENRLRKKLLAQRAKSTFHYSERKRKKHTLAKNTLVRCLGGKLSSNNKVISFIILDVSNFSIPKSICAYVAKNDDAERIYTSSTHTHI